VPPSPAYRIITMEIVKPLSIKFDSEVRKRIKKIAFLLNWPEGQFVNASIAIVLDMIEQREQPKTVPRTIFLARQVLDYDKAQQPQLTPPNRPPRSRL